MDDLDRNDILVRSRDDRERLRLLGESWKDWQAFEVWCEESCDHPSYFTNIFRRAPDEDKEKLSALLEQLQQTIETAEAEAKEKVKWELDTVKSEAEHWKTESNRLALRCKELSDRLASLPGQLVAKTRAQQIARALGQDNVKLKAKVELLERRLDAMPKTPASRRRTRRETRRSFSSVLECNFCHKRQHQVEKMISGGTVYICNECVGFCMDLLIEANVTFPHQHKLPWPDVLGHLEAWLEDEPAFIEDFVKFVQKHMEEK